MGDVTIQNGTVKADVLALRARPARDLPAGRDARIR
jgi:hypothetical protein